VKLRFFVHEEDVARARPGQQVRFSCDGCPAGLGRHQLCRARAELRRRSSIRKTRAKLVFMVEARPDPTQSPLPAGLPVSVEPLTDSPP
jgi:HlyD family secretion protein